MSAIFATLPECSAVLLSSCATISEMYLFIIFYALLCFFFFAYIICKFQAQQKKQHDSPRLNRHAAFLFIIFFRLFISCAQAYISLFAPSSQILPASRQARQICHFSEEYSPLCWAAASGQVSLFRCSSHLSSEYPSLFILCFLHARRSPHPAEAGLHLCRQI